ncbi:CRE-ECH-4 protein [Aphelenchoides besseyi]|nr:CRE-ECH-4 protein [Aphelenchoides besseyi]
MLRFGFSAANRLSSGSLRPAIHQLACRKFASQSDFDEAQKKLKTLSEEPDNDVKLQIYGLFKQASKGDVEGSRPGMLDFVGRAKFDAWNDLKGTSQEDARKKYVELVEKLAKSNTGSSASKSENQSDGTDGLKHGPEGNFYRIQFNRPDKFNAMSIPMYNEFNKAMNAANSDPNIKFTVLSAVGPYYSAGTDLTTFGKIKSREELKDMADKGAVILRDFVASFIDHDKPIIGLVHGPAIGISVTTLALLDVVYAADSATFQTPFTSLGYSPEGCSSLTFPKIFGHSNAAEMLLFGRKITAQEALDWGFVSRVFPQSTFVSETAELIKQFAELPTESLRFNKKMIRDFSRDELHRVNELECKKLAERWQGKDCAEAIMKFMKSRK